MIVYLVTGREAYTVENYLRGRGRHQQGRIVTLPYEQLSRIKSLPVATYIFSDLDRLTRAQTVIAEEVYQTITVARPDLRLLNNPASAATHLPDLKRDSISAKKASKTALVRSGSTGAFNPSISCSLTWSRLRSVHSSLVATIGARVPFPAPGRPVITASNGRRVMNLFYGLRLLSVIELPDREGAIGNRIQTGYLLGIDLHGVHIGPSQPDLVAFDIPLAGRFGTVTLVLELPVWHQMELHGADITM